MPHRPLRTMEDVRRFNEDTGHHFFEAGALRFFRSRIGDTLYGRRYFVTSEQYDHTTPRLYTVRYVDRDGSTGDVGGFQAFDTGAKARALAAACADAGTRISVEHDPYPDPYRAASRPERVAAALAEVVEPDPDRFSWRPYVYARGGTYAVGNRNTRDAAEELRCWLMAPRIGRD